MYEVSSPSIVVRFSHANDYTIVKEKLDYRQTKISLHYPNS